MEDRCSCSGLFIFNTSPHARLHRHFERAKKYKLAAIESCNVADMQHPINFEKRLKMVSL